MTYQPEAKPAQAVSELLPVRRGQEPTPLQHLEVLGLAGVHVLGRGCAPGGHTAQPGPGRRASLRTHSTKARSSVTGLTYRLPVRSCRAHAGWYGAE